MTISLNQYLNGGINTKQGTTYSVSTQTATASQTVFNIGYSIGYIDVYQNGVRLVPTADFTASNGTTVVLATGASLNDELMFVVYSNMATTNALVPADIGASVQGYNANTVIGQASAVDGEIALFDGTSGDSIKRATTTGILKATSGVIGAAVNSDLPTMTATVGGAVPTPPNNTTTFLRGDGVFAAPAAAGLTLGTAVSSTSGTSITFSGIPSGTKQIFINLHDVSLSGTSYLAITLGDAGGIETTGYRSSSSFVDSTPQFSNSNTEFELYQDAGAAGSELSGVVILNLVKASTFSWAMNAVVGCGASNSGVIITGGYKSLSQELTQVKIASQNGTDTFDLGLINIAYA